MLLIPEKTACGTPNDDVADVLDRVADRLDAQRADHFRIDAYRRAADRLRWLPESVAEILDKDGRAGLEEIPGIGARLSSAIEEIVQTGRLGLLDRLEGQVSPEDLFTTIPGIGEALAHRIHDELHVDTLEDLEAAAHDGRLAALPGFGERRTRAIREYLDATLSRSARRRARSHRRIGPGHQRPSVAAILAVDSEYGRLARAGRLHCIAPRRFNPSRRAWLPVWHVDRNGWSFTVMYSNTARAHALGKTRDWVVVFIERDGEESQATVVTEYQGELAGLRVVRGRETECRRHYHVAGRSRSVSAWAHEMAVRLAG